MTMAEWSIAAALRAVNRARKRPARSPRDPVVLAVVARPAPDGAVLPVEQDRVDRPRGALLELEGVPHPAELGADPLRHGVGDEHPAGPGLVLPERGAHLVGV